METMLKHYGYENIEDFAKEVGMHPTDAKLLLREMYETDTAPIRKGEIELC